MENKELINENSFRIDERIQAEEINKYIDYFTSIYNNKGEETNPMPKDTRITVWCDNGEGDEGFAYNATTLDMGLNCFIARKWILQNKLTELIKEDEHEK